jgi:N-acyl-D-amino-acid deacylase
MAGDFAMRIVASAVLVFFLVNARGDEPAARSKVPQSGETDASFARFDELMTEFIEKSGYPGASLAVARDAKVVYARGFGLADRDAKLALKPDALFRISSISKPITATAILQLVERGKLSLDSKVIDVLALRPPPRGFDERWKKITIRHLLEHRAGWDSKKSEDPMFLSPLIVREIGGPHPAMPNTIITYMLRRPLDFEPGEKFVYSNFGYCLLGRVIERVSKQTYEGYVKKNVLAPLGIKNMRLGRSLYLHRAPGEVKYHGNRHVPAVLGPLMGKPTPAAYGGFCLEAMDSHAGWLASASDLLRFTLAFEDPKRCKILKKETVEEMFARPSSEDEKKPFWYAKGWLVRPMPRGERIYWHDGAFEGSAGMVVRRPDRIAFAILLNCREKLNDKEPIEILDAPLHATASVIFTKK